MLTCSSGGTDSEDGMTEDNNSLSSSQPEVGSPSQESKQKISIVPPPDRQPKWNFCASEFGCILFSVLVEHEFKIPCTVNPIILACQLFLFIKVLVLTFGTLTFNRQV